MTRVQKIQLRQSELRQKIAGLLDTEVEQRSDTWTSDVDAAKSELTALETELQAAMLIEPETPETETRDGGEQREIRQLSEAASIGVYLNSIARESAVDGAERELRQALDLGDRMIPLDVLLPLDEEEIETRRGRCDERVVQRV